MKGIVDVQEIVKKFLTREQTYSQLLTIIADAEKKIDTLRNEHLQLNQQRNEIKMDTSGINLINSSYIIL